MLLAGQFRIILNYKRQASSLTAAVGSYRIKTERNNYGKNNNRLQSIRTYEKNSRRSGRDPEVSKAGYGKVWKKETLNTTT